MKAPFPSFTTEWRNDTYAAIDPSRPELSHAGKTVVITGASAGIGRAIAKAYAAAGAAKVAILARREPLLKQVKADIEAQYPKTKVTWHIADVTDRAALDRAAKEIGTWDVLVLNAGYLSQKASLVESDATEWWKGYEINILGSVLSIQAFFPTKSAQPAVVGISSAVITLPGEMMARSTSYQSSKMGLTKLLETFAVENPEVRVHILHPGVIETEMAAKGDMKDLPRDTEELPAHFIVWSTSPEGAFTASKFMYVNWDVTELKSKAEQIKAPLALTSNLVGFPWAAASA